MTSLSAAIPRRIDDKYGSRVVFGSESILAPASALRSETARLTVEGARERLHRLRMKDPKRIALHESAHAVLSVAFGRTVFVASVLPESDSLGHVVWSEPPALKDRLVIVLAGAAGECEFFPDADPRMWRGDMKNMHRLLRENGFNDRRASQPWGINLVREALDEARRLVRRYRGPIDAVANLLIEEGVLSGDRVADVVAQHGMSSANLEVL